MAQTTEVYFLGVLEAEKSHLQAPIDLVSSEDPPPGSQKAVFLLCPHVVDVTRVLSGVPHKGTNPVHEGLTLATHSPPKALSPQAIHRGQGPRVTDIH